MTPVCAVEVPDRPAGLSDLLAVLAENNVDVEYMYSLLAGKDGYAYMVLRISDEAAFEKTLVGTDIKLVGDELGLK
jgi:hypothetical protein